MRPDRIPGQCDGTGNRRRHGGHVTGRYQPARGEVEHLADPAPVERDDRGAAGHRLRDHQPVRFVPHRGHQDRRRTADQAHQPGPVQVPDVADTAAEQRGHGVGVVLRI